MLLQIGLQLRMVTQVLLVVYQGRILAKLFGCFAVGIEKLVKARQFLAVNIAVAIALAAIVTLLLMHESAWILLYLRAKFRMFPQVRLQRVMVLHEFFVIYQRGILAELLGRFAVSIQELIEARQLLAVDVAVTITILLMAVETGFLTHEGVRIVLNLLAHSRMILQISF